MTQQTKPNYFWKDSDGVICNMMEMNEKHLQFAHTHACGQEFKFHKMSGFFSDKRDQLEEVAAVRGINLAYPDEKHPSEKWGNYFCAIRQTKMVAPSIMKRPSILEFKGLEQVHVLD